jgi:hypothetical protein
MPSLYFTRISSNSDLDSSLDLPDDYCYSRYDASQANKDGSSKLIANGGGFISSARTYHGDSMGSRYLRSNRSDVNRQQKYRKKNCVLIDNNVNNNYLAKNKHARAFSPDSGGSDDFGSKKNRGFNKHKVKTSIKGLGNQ